MTDVITKQEFHHGFGALPDPRPDTSGDYSHHEFLAAAAAPITWVVKDPSTWKKYSIRDQDGSSSCVSQGTAKAMEVLTGKVASAHPIYSRRSNFPSEGMWLQDAGEIITHIGTTLESLDPSQKMGEAAMNLPTKVDTTEQVSNYFFIPVSAGIDAVAQAIDQYGHAIWCFNIDLQEWEQNMPTVVASPNIISGHCNCGVDRTLHNGLKTIVDDDSWGTSGGTIGATGQRLISEDFFNKRCTGVMVLVPWVNPTGPAPRHTFTKHLSNGLMANSDVKALQDILKYEGCMSSAIPSTGNFLSATKQAVIDWQEKHCVEVLEPAGLTSGTGIIADNSIKLLNQLYSA
jgi:hypothetical protein